VALYLKLARCVHVTERRRRRRRREQACEEQGIAIADAAIRWMYHHSALSADAGDGVILGASGLAHLQDNLTSAAAGPLPPSVVTAIDSAWEACRAVCPSYFR